MKIKNIEISLKEKRLEIRLYKKEEIIKELFLKKRENQDKYLMICFDPGDENIYSCLKIKTRKNIYIIDYMSSPSAKRERSERISKSNIKQNITTTNATTQYKSKR